MSRASHHRWLDAFTDPLASIYTFNRCMALSDLHADGDYKLILADLGSGSANIKLKVYRGTSLMTETTLLEIPIGVATLYNDHREPRIPAITLASGTNIYVYKNMKPYFRFTLPNLDVNPLESDLWIQARNDAMEPKMLYTMLENVMNEIGYSNMSVQSQKLLSIAADNNTELSALIKTHAGTPIKRTTTITAMTTLYKSSNTPDSISCIVLGTENGYIHLVDTEAFTLMESISQGGENCTDCSIPVVMRASGLYDVDFRIITYNRDGKITLLRRGWTQVKLVVHLSTQAVDIVLMGDNGNIIVATMNSHLECYSKKGKKLWDLKLPTNAMSLTTIPLHHQGLTLVAVALNGGFIHFYNGRQLVETIMAADTIAGMIFGRFGQEDHCLILVTVGGILQIKMLKRTAQFTQSALLTTPSANVNQNLKLALPKKTKLFLEQTVREKENALQIHHTFQRDMLKLRLHTARTYAESVKRRNNLISTQSDLPLKMTAQVFGLGPTFKIQLTLENMSESSATLDTLCSKKIGVAFHYNDKLYTLSHSYIQAPLLTPGLCYKMETMVRSVADLAVSDDVHVLVVSEDEPTPLISAVVYMPVCDVLPIEI